MAEELRFRTMTAEVAGLAVLVSTGEQGGGERRSNIQTHCMAEMSGPRPAMPGIISMGTRWAKLRGLDA